MIKHKVIPSAGNVVVVREKIDEVISKVQRSDGTEVGLVRGDDQSLAQRINPWALVVGVGAPRKTQYGTIIEAPCKEGDKVLVASVGRDVLLTTPDGEAEILYCLPFEGVIAALGYECSVCGITIEYGAETTEKTDTRTLTCPAGCKDVTRPTAFETTTISRTH